ncbi:MAG TPA: protein phosphatase 2C domain-containing protein, partial [Phototrophicaceae bacterium]|nr:protein phosphatase 2C domain-containing protein [Phototrophicaceae bacterium]
MGDNLRVFAAMSRHCGQHRTSNEDALGYYYPQHYSDFEAHGVLMALADGVGGLESGELASDMAILLLVEEYLKPTSYATMAAHLAAAVRQVNLTVHQIFQKSATTLVAVAVTGNQATFVNVGDSRAYYWSHGQLTQITQDHTQAVPNGAGGFKNKLTRAIGHKPALEVDTFTHTLAVGDRLVLVSDGATRYLSNLVIQEYAALPLETAVKKIIDESNRAGGIDNISVLILELGTPVKDESDFRAHRSAQPNFYVSIPDGPPATEPLPVPVLPPPMVLPPVPAKVSSTHRQSRIPILVLLLLFAIGVGVVALRPQLQAELERQFATAVPSQSSPTAAATLIPTLPDNTLRVNRVLTFEESAVTYKRIGQDTAAFALKPAQPYRLQEIYTMPDTTQWYR